MWQGFSGNWRLRLGIVAIILVSIFGVWQQFSVAHAATYRNHIARVPNIPDSGQTVRVWMDSDTVFGESACLEYNVNSSFVKVCGTFDNTGYAGANWRVDIPAFPNGTYVQYQLFTRNSGGDYGFTGFNWNYTVYNGDVDFNSLKHDSFDSYYRSPFGAVPSGSSVTLRLRAKTLNLNYVALRVYTYDGRNESNSAVAEYPLTYLEDRTENGTNYAIWSVTLTVPSYPSILYYNFRAVDRLDTAYYGDSYSNDHDNLGQGGDGVASDNESGSFQLTVYDAAFTTPDWLKNANVYQIFPDRFRNGNINNDYCRPGSTSGCPTFYGSPYPNPVPTTLIHTTWNEAICNPRDNAGPCPGAYGNQFFGGDLKGIEDKLDYLRGLGFDTIYVNPIFAARSNHRYDADDFLDIDAALGGKAAYDSLIAAMNRRGMRLIVDGVWNHVSQDSRYFDYYNRFPTASPKGACQDANSSFRTWFHFFNNDAPCDFTDYSGWFGFGGLPEFEDSSAQMRDFIYRTPSTNVTQYWYDQGTAGWRFDVAVDISHNFWRDYRGYAKTYKSDGPLIGELFPDASKWFLGNELDSAMNYRFRKNVLGYARSFDWADNDNNNGDNNRIIGLTPSQFNRAMLAVLEDYPGPTNAVMLNLIDSHDTNRALYTLGVLGETAAQTKERLQLAAIVQFTHIGAPMVYYGDEIALNSPSLANNPNNLPEDDPYNRAPYPWADEAGNTSVYGPADDSVKTYYTKLANLRKQHPALRNGTVTALLMGDLTASTTDNNTYSYIRVNSAEKVVVALNNGQSSNTVSLPVSSYFTDGTKLYDPLNATTYTVASGAVALTLPARSGLVLVNKRPPTFTPNTSGMSGSALTVEQGAASVSGMVASIADTPITSPISNAPAAGPYTVTATYVPAGITLNNLQVAMDGTVTATATAACNATVGANTVEFTVTDADGLTNRTDVIINVAANAAPTVGTYTDDQVLPGGSVTVTPASAPADNGSVSSVTVNTPAGYTGGVSVNATTGAITLTNAGPQNTLQNFTVTLTDNCGLTSTKNAAVYILGPTAARVASYRGYNFNDGNMLRWQSSFEADNLGFEVLRARADDCAANDCLERITPDIIAGSSLFAGTHAPLTAGRAYSWWDKEGRPDSVYFIEDIDLSGKRTRHGPITATACDKSTAECQAVENLRPSPVLSALNARAATTSGANISTAPARTTSNAANRAAAESASRPTTETLSRQAWLANSRTIKIGVTQTGWQRVTEAQLVAAGLPAETDAKLLQLYADGVEIPLYVRTAKGTDSGALEAGGVIEFYGVGLDTTDTDTRTYWLTVGEQTGLRIGAPKRVAPRTTDGEGQQAAGSRQPAANAEPAADSQAQAVEGANETNGKTRNEVASRLLPAACCPPSAAASSFPLAVERKDRTLYFPALRNGDASNFFGAVVGASAVAQTLPVQHLDATTTDLATLEIALQGATDGPHSVRVSLNGNELGVMTFAAQANKKARFRVPQTALREGENTVTLQSAGSSDVSVTDYLRLTYAHRYQATDNVLTFTTTPRNSVTVNGFTASQVRVFDITDPQRPFAVSSSTAPEASGYAVTVNSNLGARMLLAVADNRVIAPASVTANEPSNWLNANRSADFLIIAPREFRATVAPLAAARNAQGLATEIVTLEDVYDETNFGTPSAAALSEFLRYTTEKWQRAPRYILLAGDASFDPRNYLGYGAHDYVPTRFVGTAQLETSSDEALADFDGDGVAELSIGRLPARTPAQLAAMIAKTLNYTPQTANGALLVADDADGATHARTITDLHADLPAAMSVTSIQRGAQPDAATRSQILAGLNAGPSLVAYAGHGSVETWTSASLLQSTDAANLSNSNRLPLFVSLTCLNGYFHDIYSESLAEALVKAPNGGAVASWASSALTVPTGQAAMGREFIRALYARNDAVLLGDAVRQAKRATIDREVRDTWILFGDPTLRVR